MPKRDSNKGKQQRARSTSAAKYDTHHRVLDETYGALADLRRELADSKESLQSRREILQQFSEAKDKQRAWNLLEDYFNQLALSRKDFSGDDWWPRLMAADGASRLEELATVFMRSERPIPTELSPHANVEGFLQWQQSEQDRQLSDEIEAWLSASDPNDHGKSSAPLRVRGKPEPIEGEGGLHQLTIDLLLVGPTGDEQAATPGEVLQAIGQQGQQHEQFAPADWQLVQWLSARYADHSEPPDQPALQGAELLQWLAQWGQSHRIETDDGLHFFSFFGQSAYLKPTLEKVPDTGQTRIHYQVVLADGKQVSLSECRCFAGRPSLILSEITFYILHNAPGESLLQTLTETASTDPARLSQRSLTLLYRRYGGEGTTWDALGNVRSAKPRFLFELNDEAIRLQLKATDAHGEQEWVWNGEQWEEEGAEAAQPTDRPRILDDARLDAAVEWLNRLDWSAPQPGVWETEGTQEALEELASHWAHRPSGADFKGNRAFHRLFLDGGDSLKPKLVVGATGIDWFTVSTAWESGDVELSERDRRHLESATDPFVHLPDAGWARLDQSAVESAQSTAADLGLGGLSPDPKEVPLINAGHLDSSQFEAFAQDPALTELRDRVAHLRAIPETPLPQSIHADLRPYQKEGFDFLCHLARSGVGGVLADDMGLGKTLQTLALLAWLQEQSPEESKPALVICPASVLHNWQREAGKFYPGVKSLLLESGGERHHRYKEITNYDLVIINYALLRQDVDMLRRVSFGLIVLDEAQFIKNPAAQVTRSVKRLHGDRRLALTGTPLENRILDLWSIVDFVQPKLLGTQSQFTERYQGSRENPMLQKLGLRRLNAKLRPIILRRRKQEVARDLPERIESRLTCKMETAQRRLYRSELQRSRTEVFREVEEKGVSQSKLHVLAALTRLRQICCHPELIGSDAPSGKTSTLFETLEPLLEEGQKILVFSQFVQMLKLLDRQCHERSVRTYSLTGQTKNRHEVVNAFQEDPNPAVFLLSLRAAGTGLNLTTASYVILYDPWWNPAVEAQAIDRTHRIGQTQTVNAYRLITPGTVEEKIWKLQQQKAQTISDVLEEESLAQNLTENDLDYLFAEEEEEP